MRKRIWTAVALGLGALLLVTGATCGTGGTSGNAAGGGGHVEHVRLHVHGDKRTVAGHVTVTWSDPESNDRHEMDVKGAWDWTHDADIPPKDSIVATAYQTTGGTVTCWYTELTPQGVDTGTRLTVVETITTPGVDLECNYANPGHVD